MIWYFIPYDLEGRLLKAYDRCFSLVTNPNDWVCLMDGDVLFFHSDFGSRLTAYVRKYPDTGLFTAFASRIGNIQQVLSPKLHQVDSIKYHYNISNDLWKKELKVTELTHPVSGFLMIIRKSTWEANRDRIIQLCHEDRILKVDNHISAAILEAGMPIRRMDTVYLLHYYRMVEGKENRGIL